MATSQGYFSKWQLPQCTLPSDNFPGVFFQVVLSLRHFLKWQLPKCVILQAETTKVFPSCSARTPPPPQCSLRRLRKPNLTFGKLPLGKLHIWEVPIGKLSLGELPNSELFALLLHFEKILNEIKSKNLKSFIKTFFQLI